MAALYDTKHREYFAEEQHSSVTSSEQDEPPSPPPKDTQDPTAPDPTTPDLTIRSPYSAESYFSPLGLSRTNSIYTLSRASFSNQLAQLTSLNLPDAYSLSSSVSSIPTATTAAKVLSNAAVQIQRWIQKAAEVLGGLNAEDDVEWAAAGGREGLGEVDSAVGKFEGLVRVYVVAIEGLQKREDISKVPREDLKLAVDTMDIVLEQWENVRNLLKGVKEQVELAMEWEELWNVVLGDIGLEMDNLSQLVYEMEEKRHKAMAKEAAFDATVGLDIQELETIVEESPLGNNSVNKASHRFSLPAGFPASSPIESPGMPSPHEDSSLLALFARMQPLRASLDFLPMRLSGFQSRAEAILPTACEELESRRMTLERQWKKLESDAEALRRELGEDRWVMAFRTAGRQVQKMCESVERSVAKLQEAIDVGAQHNNPPMLAKRIEAYEAKRTHYGPAIPRVLAMIEKGVNERRTINGEVIRLHADTKAMWAALEADIRDMDLSLDDLNMHKSQQLRDSMSSIVSNDISTAGSTVETPGSSPASSVVNSPAVGPKSYVSTPEHPSASRRSSSMMAGSSSHPPTARRNMGSSRNASLSRAVTASSSTLRNTSPHSTATHSSSATPTPPVRQKRPSTLASDNKPRWNASPKVDYGDLSHSFKSLSLKAPLPYAKNYSPYRNSRASSSNLALPSPLGREQSSSPAPSASSTTNPRSRLHSGAASSLTVRTRRHTSPSPARASQNIEDITRSRVQSRFSIQVPPVLSSSPRRSLAPSDLSLSPVTPDDEEGLGDDSPTVRPKLGSGRPSTALGGPSRRSSMLPVPKARVGSGRESSLGI